MRVLFPKTIETPPQEISVEEPKIPEILPVERKDLSIIIDFSNLVYRSIYAFRELRHNNRYSGHIYGSVLSLLTLHKEYNPSYNVSFFFALDGYPLWRKKLFPAYKAGRNRDFEWDPVQPTADLFDLIPGTFLHNPEEEADDVIASFISKSRQSGRKFLIQSADKDMWALLSDDVDVIGNRMSKASINDVNSRFFTKNPGLVSLSKAIIGDPLDNLPKVLRFSRKDLGVILNNLSTASVDGFLTMAKNLAESGGITKLSYQRLLENEQQIRKTFSLASLRDTISVTETKTHPNFDKLVFHLNAFGCFGLVPRLEALFRGI